MFRRVTRYLDEVVRVRQRLDGLTDRRTAPRIAPLTVWLCGLGLYLRRLRSLTQLEQAVRSSRRWAGWLEATPPSADTIGYALARFELAGIRALLAQIHHRIKRNYHRVVVCQLVGAAPALILDLELQRPDEGEVATARRLRARVVHRFPRFFAVVTLDALYVQAPRVNDVLAAGKEVVVVLKQEDRALDQDTHGLLALIEPERIVEPKRTLLIWDVPELTTFTGVERPVRVMRSMEILQRRLPSSSAGATPAGTSKTAGSMNWCNTGTWITASSTIRRR